MKRDVSSWYKWVEYIFYIHFLRVSGLFFWHHLREFSLFLRVFSRLVHVWNFSGFVFFNSVGVVAPTAMRNSTQAAAKNSLGDILCPHKQLHLPYFETAWPKWQVCHYVMRKHALEKWWKIHPDNQKLCQMEMADCKQQRKASSFSKPCGHFKLSHCLQSTARSNACPNKFSHQIPQAEEFQHQEKKVNTFWTNVRCAGFRA